MLGYSSRITYSWAISVIKSFRRNRGWVVLWRQLETAMNFYITGDKNASTLTTPFFYRYGVAIKLRIIEDEGALTTLTICDDFDTRNEDDVFCHVVDAIIDVNKDVSIISESLAGTEEILFTVQKNGPLGFFVR